MLNHTRRIVSAILLAAVLSLAFGCQPNPTVPPVVGKGNLEDKIRDRTTAPAASAALASAEGTAVQTQAPAEQEAVHVNFTGGKLTVIIDAVPEMPGASKLPVVKVAPRKFTQAEVDQFIKVLFQGKPAYKPKEVMTKAELQKQIVDLKAMKSRMKDDDKGLNKIDYAIADCQEKLKTAPEKVDPAPSDGKLKTDDMGGQQLYVTTNLGKANDASLDVYSSKAGRTCSLWFTNEESGESYLGTESKLDTASLAKPRGVTMTLEAARVLAEQTVKDLGADLKLANISLGTCRGMKFGASDPNAPQAYLFAFTREVNGVASTYESDIGGNVPQEEIDRADKGEKDYIEPHPYERILMAVNDTGILELQWTSPDTVKGTVSEDVQTLSFEQILQTFEKQFFIHNALKNKEEVKPSTDKRDGDAGRMMEDYAKQLRDTGIFTLDSIGYGESVKTCTYNIDRITLGLTRIAVKDKPDEFMVVPVWDFFGSVSVEYLPESGFQGFTATEAYKSFLTVNAIDGSIVNRGCGY